MHEEWRAIPGFEGAYEVSSHGRVRSLDRELVYERIDHYSGRRIRITKNLKGRVLRPGRQGSGHLSVVLGRAAGSYLVHVLVLMAFVGPCPTGCESLHRDDVPSNNELPNLRWGTRSENLHDAVANGKKPIGENVRNAKLTSADIPEIRELLPVISLAEIARKYDVAEATIRQIKTGRSWSHA